MKLYTIVIVALLMTGFRHTVLACPDDAHIRELGRKAAALCAPGKAKDLHAMFSAKTAAALPLPQLEQVYGQLFAGGNTLMERVSETITGQTYLGTHKWADRELVVTVSFDSEDKVVGLFFKPQLGKSGIPPDPKAGYVNKSIIRLPFDGEWWVFWGGPEVALNYHVAHADQRHAYDILILKEGKTFRKNRDTNEEFYAFGQPLLAPVGGTVVSALDGIPDNKPGVMNSRQIYGNHVVIDMGDGEFLVMCHFKNGSLLVKTGDKVKAGQKLGLCGNSGNSSEPHLHIHLQDRKELGFGAISLPLPFSNYLANGKPVAKGVPVRGTTIKPGK